MNNLFSQSNFCQFGGHDSKTPRTGLQLLAKCFPEDNGRYVSIWPVCTICSEYVQGDPTMFILYKWSREGDDTRELPTSLRENPLMQSLLIDYVDKFLNNNIRRRLGNRFPIFLADLNESEKNYFLQELEQDTNIRENFIHDVKDGAKRKTIALKLWVGCISGSKGTRKKHNVAGRGQEEYTPEQREVDFKVADQHAKVDEIFRAGVEDAPILELLLRHQPEISLERAKSNSPIKTYVKDKTKNIITKYDLDLSGGLSQNK